MTQPTALLTGAGGGLGACTARYLAAKGWHVFATDCRGDALGALGDVDNITPITMDVTDTTSLRAAAKAVTAQTAGLDGVVTFAGVLAIGSLVEMDEETLLHVLDVNVMGTFRTNRAFFPLVLERKGRFVVISSETGQQKGGPFAGAYAMSKHAIEAYADSLRRELMFLGVPVVKIQPGPFKTDMVASIERNFARAAEKSTHLIIRS